MSAETRSEEDAALISELEKRLWEAEYVLWRTQLLYRTLRRLYHWLDAWRIREGSAWWYLAPFPFTAGRVLKSLFKILPRDDELTRKVYSRVYRRFVTELSMKKREEGDAMK